MNKRKVIKFALGVILLMGCQKNQTSPTPINTVDCNTVTYKTTIQPLFETKCISCHGINSPDGDLSTYEKTKIYADNDKLKNEVLTQRSMPIGTTLTSQQLGQIKCWLDSGAPGQ